MPLQLHYKELKFALLNSRIKIGRAPLNEIAIPADQQLSSQHCTITNGILLDTRSTNGTTVNGKKVTHGAEVELHHNDIIVAGETEFNIIDSDIDNTSNDHEKIIEESKQTNSADNDDNNNLVHIVDDVIESDSVVLTNSSSPSDDTLDINSIMDQQQRSPHIEFNDNTNDNSDGDTYTYKPNSLVTCGGGSNSVNVNELQYKINELISANQHLEQRLAHQQRRQNLASNKLKMQRFESQIESLQYQLLYGDSIKDQEIQLLQKKLDALNHTRSKIDTDNIDTSRYDDLTQSQLIELMSELQVELIQTNQKHTQALRQLHLLSQQLRDTQTELEATKLNNNNTKTSNQAIEYDNQSSSEYNKTMKFDSKTTELLRTSSCNAHHIPSIHPNNHIAADIYATQTQHTPLNNFAPESATSTNPIKSINLSSHSSPDNRWLNQSVLIASSVSVVCGMMIATVFK